MKRREIEEVDKGLKANGRLDPFTGLVVGVFMRDVKAIKQLRPLGTLLDLTQELIAFDPADVHRF